MRNNAVLLFLILLALALPACDLVESLQQLEATPEATAPPSTPVGTAVSQSTPEFTITVTPTVENVQFTIWLPPKIAAASDASKALFEEQILAFNNLHPELEIRVEPKAVSGVGGILNYLRTGREVAPDVLPDLIAVQVELLSSATTENLIFPLTDQLDENQLEQLYPAARTMAESDGQVLGYPFVLTDLPHLVYNTNAITATLPLTWDRLITGPNHSMILAADGEDGAVLALQFYLDAGGTVVNEAGRPALDLEPLTLALEQVQKGHESGFFVTQSSTTSTQEQAWQAFQGSGANITRTSADFFLLQETAEFPIGFTVNAGIDRPLTPVIRGWAWAVSTPDPVKRTLAAELITELTAPKYLSEWTAQSSLLPARRDAFAIWQEGGDSYVIFLGPQLERATPLPVTSGSALMVQLQDAVFQVISGAKTAEEAAAAAVQALGS